MKNSIIKNVSIVLICSILAKVFSYIWEAVLAAYLGVTDTSDALYMAIGVFNILYPILDMGIWKVFLPIYKTKMVKDSEDGADEFANVAESFFIIVSVVLVIMIAAFAQPITWIMAPGFSPEVKRMTIEFVRLSAPMYLLMASASVVGAVLQCHDKFFGSQLRELATHVSKIVAFIITFRFFGVYAAILAFIIGSVFRLLIQIPFIDWKWKFKLNFSFKVDEMKTLLRGLPSVSLTSAIDQLNAMIDRIIASGLAAGSVSYLNYGNKLMSVFSGMISMAIATAVYPMMVQYIAEEEEEKLKTLVGKSICATTFFIMPINLFCVFYSTEIVEAAFQRGAFDSSATLMTSNVFLGYALGILFLGLTTLITNLFYAFGDTVITMKISALNIMLNIVLNIILSHYLGVMGLALATSISTTICFIIRMMFLKRFIVIPLKETGIEILKIVICSIFSCTICLGITSHLNQINVFLLIFLCCAIIGSCYFVLLLIVKSQTVKLLINKVIKK